MATPTRPSPHLMPITASYFVAFIILGAAVGIMGPTLQALADNTGVSLGRVGLYLTSFNLGYIVGTQLAGNLLDRFTGHRVMSIMLVLTALCLLLVPYVGSFALLLFFGFSIGVVTAGVDVGGNTLIMWLHGSDVNPYMNALHAFFGVGAFIAPLVVAWALAQSDSIVLAYTVLAVLTLSPLWWLLRLPSPTIQPDTLETNGHAQPRGVDWVLIGMLVGFIFLYAGIEVTLGSWLFTYAEQMNLADEQTAAYLNSAFWGAFTVGRLMGVPIARRFAPRFILLMDLLGALLFVGLMLVWVNEVVIWIGVLGVGFSIASVFPTIMNLAEKNTRMTGQITSLVFFGAGGGGLLLPSIMGWLFEATSAQILMWIALGSFSLTLMMYVALIRHVNRHHADPIQAGG